MYVLSPKNSSNCYISLPLSSLQTQSSPSIPNLLLLLVHLTLSSPSLTVLQQQLFIPFSTPNDALYSHVEATKTTIPVARVSCQGCIFTKSLSQYFDNVCVSFSNSLFQYLPGSEYSDTTCKPYSNIRAPDPVNYCLPPYAECIFSHPINTISCGERISLIQLVYDQIDHYHCPCIPH